MDPDLADRLCAVYISRAHVPRKCDSLTATFDNARTPPISIAAYFERCRQELGLTNSNHVLAYLYAARLTGGYSLEDMHAGNVFKILAVCNLLSLKFLSDHAVNMTSSAVTLGVSCGELCAMEVRTLALLGWTIYVGVEEYEECLGEIRAR